MQPFYPTTRIELSEPQRATLVLIDPTRPFDWSQYVAILNNVIVAYRDWADAIVNYRLLVSIEPYIIPQAKLTTPFSPALLSGYSLLILQHPLLTTQQKQRRQAELNEAESGAGGVGATTTTTTPPSANANINGVLGNANTQLLQPPPSSLFMDDVVKAHISFAMRFLRLPCKFWPSSLESFTLPTYRYILVTHEKLSSYGYSRGGGGGAESLSSQRLHPPSSSSSSTTTTTTTMATTNASTNANPQTITECPTNAALRQSLDSFAAVWSTNELLTYLSTATVPPLPAPPSTKAS